MPQSTMFFITRGHKPTFSPNETLWTSWPESLRLDAGGLDYFGPFLGFVGDELAEVGGRARKHSATKVGKARLHFGISEARIDLLAQLLDDLCGCVLGYADAIPRWRLVAWHEFSHGWYARQRLRARRGRYR